MVFHFPKPLRGVGNVNVDSYFFNSFINYFGVGSILLHILSYFLTAAFIVVYLRIVVSIKLNETSL